MATVKRNVVGPQIGKLRDKRGMTQEMFAAKCALMGLELSRVMVAKIETRRRCVLDSDVWVFARVLKVDMKELYPGGKR